MNKKKVLLVLSILALLFLMSGCAIPTDENGQFIRITDDTTFQYMMTNEGIFAAIFVYPLSKFINFMVPRTNVAVAIALVTVTINLVVTLLTWRSNMATQKMQMIQPELARIQKKYEGRDDQNSKMRQAQEMQNLYNKHGINPMGSLLVSFIQFPILIAMYHAVQRSVYVANGSVFGLSLATSPLQGISEGKYGYLVIFALMVITQLISMKVPQWLSERRAKAEAEKHFRRYEKPANPNQATMYFMMVFISVLLISWPTSMSFYYVISSLTMILKNLLLDRFINKEMEAVK